MIRKVLRKYWSLFLGITTFIIGGLITLSSKFETRLNNLEIGGQPITIYYWANLFYEHLAYPLTGFILLAIVVLTFVLMFQWSQERQRQAILTTFGAFLSVAAFVLSLLGILPNFWVGYTHLDVANFNEHQYNLGVKVAIDGDFSYIICTCDHLGFYCKCCAVDSATSYGWRDAKLVQDFNSNSLMIKGSDGTIDLQNLDCVSKQ